MPHNKGILMNKCLLGLISLFCVFAADAEIINISPSQDNTLYENAGGTLSNGSGQYLFAGTTALDSIRRGLIGFDLAAIPDGSTITNVTLQLNMSRTISGAQTISLHAISAGWGEGASNAAGQEGSGAPSSTGDATWIHRDYSTVSWTSAGGDFNPTASASGSVAGVGQYNWSSAGLIADVQYWLDNPTQNFGWLIAGDETTIGTAKRFDTREHPTESNRPVLTVGYVIPEPSSVMLICSGITCLFLFRRKTRR